MPYHSSRLENVKINMFSDFSLNAVVYALDVHGSASGNTQNICFYRDMRNEKL